MRILHIAYSCIPGSYRGGVSRVVCELSAAQAKLDHEVTVYTTNTNSSQILPELSGTVTDSGGVRIQYYPLSNRRWYTSKALQLDLQKCQETFDVVHSHNTFLALNRYAAEWRRITKCPLFYHVHGAFDPVLVHKGALKRLRKLFYIYLFERKNYHTASALIGLSSQEIRQVRQFGVRTPMVVIPNGIGIPDLDLLHVEATPFRQQWNIDPSDLVVFFVGRIVPKKGLHLLLPAMARLKQSYPQVKLVIAGNLDNDPAYAERLQHLEKTLDLGETIRWTGFLNEDEKAGAWGAADIFSHVTESEGMAMAPLEAMAAGLPVLVSPENNLSHATAAQAVMECEYSVEDIEIGLAKLIADAELRHRLGKAARRYIESNHQWKTVAARTIELYEQYL